MYIMETLGAMDILLIFLISIVEGMVRTRIRPPIARNGVLKPPT